MAVWSAVCQVKATAVNKQHLMPVSNPPARTLVSFLFPPDRGLHDEVHVSLLLTVGRFCPLISSDKLLVIPPSKRSLTLRTIFDFPRGANRKMLTTGLHDWDTCLTKLDMVMGREDSKRKKDRTDRKLETGFQSQISNERLDIKWLLKKMYC